jgi:hypothetical protein
MSRTRILLATLGLAAAVGVPAIALAGAVGAGGSCCEGGGSCRSKQAVCCDQPDPTITCPMTGEKIKASECPLCCKDAK